MDSVEVIPSTPIFVVDDEPRLLAVLCESLRTLGLPVVPFGSPKQCLDALANTSCRLLVTDVSMPEMDGLELMRQARAIRPLLPVLVITGFGDVPLAVRALQEGAFDFVEKPIDERTFLPRVQKALKNSTSSHLDVQSLTNSERRILKLVGEGKSNKEIAALVGRSLRTIENHRYRLMHKLQVDSTAKLAELALAMKGSSSD